MENQSITQPAQQPCHGETCPCMQACPLAGALEMIGGKWKLRILCALMQDGTTRYNALKRKVAGITNTMLAAALKELEQDDLVQRRQYAEVPVRVEYTATPRCQALMPILMELAQWRIGVAEEQKKGGGTADGQIRAGA